MDQARIQAAAAQLGAHLHKVRTPEKKAADEKLFERFQPLFSPSRIPDLLEKDFVRFTLFSENLHWSGIHRHNGRILKDFNRLKEVLTILLDESRPIAERIDQFRPKGKGKAIKFFGSSIYTAILFTLYPDKYPVLNRKTVLCLRKLGLFPGYYSLSHGERYEKVVSLSHALCRAIGCTISELDGLYDYFAQADGADIEGVRVFKLSPGAKGKSWDEFMERGVAAIGWNSSGSLKSAEVDLALCAERVVKAGMAGNQAYIASQFQIIRDELTDGDIILFYVDSHIVGAGTICGSYRFNPEFEMGHERPVKFIRPFKPVDVSTDPDLRSFFFENVTLKEFEDEDLKDRVLALIEDENPGFLKDEGTRNRTDMKTSSSTSSFQGIRREAFDLLRRYEASPFKETFQKTKGEYEELLRDPVKALFKALAPDVRSALGDTVETSKGIVSIILKNDYGKGGIHGHYWGAFYPFGLKRTESAQLFAIFYPNELRFGFGFGHKSKNHERRLIERINEGDWLERGFFEKLEKAGVTLRVWSWTEKINTYQGPIDQVVFEQAAYAPEKSVNFDVSISPEEVHGLGPRLVARIQETFRLVYPLFILAMENDPATLMASLGEDNDTLNMMDEDLDDADFQMSWEEACKAMNWQPQGPMANQVLTTLGGHLSNLKESPNQVIFYGPPGTGKTWACQNLARALTKSENHVRQVQFHQSYGYEQFIEGIWPTLKDGQLTYEFKKGVFVELCDAARRRPQEQFIMIIDEINRGNVSKIFGELLYLLEYRDKSLPLLYSREQFSIPTNVSIFATMNSADRSLALVDYALRRRFRFIELGFQGDVLRQSLNAPGHPEAERCVRFIEVLNARLGDPRLHIGHAYLMGNGGNMDRTILRRVWDSQIFPLLQEYFLAAKHRLEGFDFESLWEEASPERLDKKVS